MGEKDSEGTDEEIEGKEGVAGPSASSEEGSVPVTPLVRDSDSDIPSTRPSTSESQDTTEIVPPEAEHGLSRSSSGRASAGRRKGKEVGETEPLLSDTASSKKNGKK